MAYKVIDVSEWQGYIDWQKVRNAGITAAIIRVGGRFGASGVLYKDTQAVNNLSGAIKAGLKVGAYFFTQAVNESEARAEAEATIEALKPYKNSITMPVAYDTEYLDGGRHNYINRAQRTAAARAFCETIKKAGYIPMVYGSTSWLNNQLDMSKLSDIDTWVAQYYARCTYGGKYTMWQYSSTGKVSGIAGNTDMNECYKSYGSGGNNTPVQESAYLNEDDITMLQKWLGTPQDGWISGQWNTAREWVPNIIPIEYNNGDGSVVVGALQKMLLDEGYKVVGEADRFLGPKTVKGWQSYLNAMANAKLDVDGIFGPLTAKATRSYLKKVVKA